MKTAIDPSLAGTLEPVVTVAERRIGSRPAPSTLWRWCRKGLKGGRIRLNAVYVNKRWMTTDQAFDQFLVEQTESELNVDQHRNINSDVDEQLREAGLL